MSASLRQCVNQACLNCAEGDVWAIGNCKVTECALYEVRPNKNLFGKKPSDFDPHDIEQQVLDNLNLKGLKEMIDDHEV
jgi:hypothetical protein